LASVFVTAEADTVVGDRCIAGMTRCVRCTPDITPAHRIRRASERTEWVLLTSGTTGAPKLVAHNLCSLSGAMAARGPLGAGAVWSTFYDMRRYGGLQIFLRAMLGATFDLDEYAFNALRAGASGFLLKDVPPAELVAAIRTVARGDAVVSPRITRRLLEEYAHTLPDLADGAGMGGDAADEHPSLASLTEREREVLLAVADGLSNAEIAERLYVSEATVKSHVGRLLAKLGLRDRVQAVVFAFQSGLVQP
jgi:DNA-binding NarL/FixJ family response regulator